MQPSRNVYVSRIAAATAIGMSDVTSTWLEYTPIRLSTHDALMTPRKSSCMKLIAFRALVNTSGNSTSVENWRGVEVRES